LGQRDREFALIDATIAAMQEKARPYETAMPADFARRLRNEFPTHLVYARAAVGPREALDLIDECERRGDRSWYADGSKGVYYINFMDE
jgi:hypothetical protein